MKQLLSFLMLIGCTLFLTIGSMADEKVANKYVGVKICSMCHKSESTGNQFGIWQKSKHAGAYKTLTSDKANAIAKEKGLTKPAAESPECLECHTITADAKLTDKSFDAKDGVQCEACHGPGSSYKTMSTMKDKAKAIAAGLAEYKDDAAIEKHCRTCHNDKSPTKKEFNLKDMWGKIKHPLPKKS